MEMPQRRLVVIGDGPDLPRLAKLAAGNIVLLGSQPSDVLRDYLRRARAFVFAAEEDFGIAPLEAQACGTPVIAFGKGGALETIRGLDHAQPTGLFFHHQNVKSLVDAVEHFETKSESFSTTSCRENALRFSEDAFQLRFRSVVMNYWASFSTSQRDVHN